jgi:type I protein arginine methyltransferase
MVVWGFINPTLNYSRNTTHAGPLFSQAEVEMRALSVAMGEGLPSTLPASEKQERVNGQVMALGSKARDFPAWHFAMLNDGDRNQAIEHTISRLELQGKTVFEVGTGCGLVALLFAKYGANHVYTCETNARMAEIASAVIGGTSLRDKITLFRTSSSVVVQQGMLPVRPDIIFTETLDCGVVGEGFDSVANDIRMISGSGTIVIPATIQQFGMLVEAPALAKLNCVDEACGFDISALNTYSTRTYFPVRERLYDYTPLSEAFLMHEYSYQEERPIAPSIAIAYRSGAADGVLSWFEAQFGNETITNSPGTHGHWHQAFHPFDERVEVQAKQEVSLSMDAHGHLVVRIAG